jgi:hypothetical protein
MVMTIAATVIALPISHYGDGLFGGENGNVSLLPAHVSPRDPACVDFPTPQEAQTFFLAHGGPKHDPASLDGDGDGVACESTSQS